MFHLAIGVTLVVGGCLLASAVYGDGPLLSSRTAAQITGWLCICAILVELCTTLRARGLRHLRRPSFAQGVAGATTLCTGAIILYLSYFEWSDFPAAPIREAAAAAVAREPVAYKIAELPRGMPDASFIPVQADLYRSSKVARPPTWQLVATATQLHVPDEPCATERGVWRLLCEEQVRVEYCAGRQDFDAVCPSPIPASPPH
jgi:hypothetical protein